MSRIHNLLPTFVLECEEYEIILQVNPGYKPQLETESEECDGNKFLR